MEPKRTLHSGNLVRGVHAEEEERFIKKLVDLSLYWQEESFQILKKKTLEWGKRIIIARDYKEMAKMREWRADRA